MAVRIVSLVPSATEIVASLGLVDQLVGRSHECDFPPEVAQVPALTASLIPADLAPQEVDAWVSRVVREQGSPYRLDHEALRRLGPDLVLTQGVCQVCAVSYAEVQRAVANPCQVVLPEAAPTARTLSLAPERLQDVLDDIERVAEAAGVPDRGRAVRRGLEARIEAVRERSRGLLRPRVFCMEWLAPPWCGGHWVPEMVELAGGQDCLGEVGQPSRRLRWEDVRAADPDVIVLMPCGYDLDETLRQYRQVLAEGGLPAWWGELRAVREGRLFAVDAGACFSRPGPRLVDGLETLAEILHPERFGRERMGRQWAPVSGRVAA
ncbi:MAG TPA: cobalamin-binding protein [Limnochordales bacterium]